MTTLDTTIATLVEQSVEKAVAKVLADLSSRPLVVTAEEAADLLHVSRRTVDKWLKDGLIPRMPHTTKILIPRIGLEEFVAGRAIESEAS